MSGKRSLSILKSTQLTWSQISWEEENTLNSTQMTWRSRKILSQNSQIHTIDLESNKFRGRKHSEFHSNDLEIKKNPLNFFENNMSWEDFLPLKYLQVRWSFSQRFRVFFPRLAFLTWMILIPSLVSLFHFWKWMILIPSLVLFFKKWLIPIPSPVSLFN